MLEFNYNDSVEDMLPCRERSHVIEAKSIKEKFKVIDVNGGEMLGDAGDYLVRTIEGDLFIVEANFFGIEYELY